MANEDNPVFANAMKQLDEYGEQLKDKLGKNYRDDPRYPGLVQSVADGRSPMFAIGDLGAPI